MIYLDGSKTGNLIPRDRRRKSQIFEFQLYIKIYCSLEKYLIRKGGSRLPPEPKKKVIFSAIKLIEKYLIRKYPLLSTPYQTGPLFFPRYDCQHECCLYTGRIECVVVKQRRRKRKRETDSRKNFK